MKGAQKKEFVVSNSLSILYPPALNVPLTSALLRFDPMRDPFRNDPCFTMLIESFREITHAMAAD
jgi:hypothetical protein